MQWALDKYGEKSAADLELLSTIVHANRETRRHKALDEVARNVKKTKPPVRVRHRGLDRSSLLVQDLPGMKPPRMK
jgi:hypothetical protein